MASVANGGAILFSNTALFFANDSSSNSTALIPNRSTAILANASPTSISFQLGEPPEPIVSDYVELATLILLFIVGAPLNLAAYTQIAERPACTRLDILKRHLNCSDLLVLFIYVPSRACWLTTYDWRGGDFLCKFIKFMHTFTFQVSSNVIVCIAMDRLLTVISSSHHNPERAHRRMRLILTVAWITALIISAPQFAIWRSYLAFEHLQWSQCMQIWEILRAEAYFKNSTQINANQLMQEENVYVVVHMFLIFWIPAIIILLCYLIVSCWVYFNSKPSFFVNAVTECVVESKTIQNRGSTVVYQQPITVKTQAHTVVSTHYHNLQGYHNPYAGPTSEKNPKIFINDELTKPLTQDNNLTTVIANNTASVIKDDKNGNANRGSTSSTTTALVNGRQGSMFYNVRNSQSSSYSAKVNRSRAIRVSFSLVAAYIICWLPYNALSLIQFVDPVLFNKHANKVYCLHGMIVFNSVINPYLYGLFGRLCKSKR